MRERHRLRAWPLTPIHIGTGQDITPESFVLRDGRLWTFNPFGALSRATEPQRAHYQKLLKGGDFIGAQRHLAGLATTGQPHEGEGVRVSDASLGDVRKVLGGDFKRAGRLSPFIRCGETPIVPGSSLKGALRTAWVEQAMVDRDQHGIVSAISGVNTKAAAQALEKRALDIEGKALEQDPFRDLVVADSPMPTGTTRFDKAVLGKLAGERLDFQGTSGIQMHVERLDSVADGGSITPFEVLIDLPPQSLIVARANARRDKRVTPRTPIEALALWRATNRFHAALWLYERNRFYGAGPTATVLDGLLLAFGLKPDDALADQLTNNGLILLRLGRYSQFESKSVRIDGQRHGVKAATRGAASKAATLMDAGGTRTTVAVAGGVHIPFGWLILAVEGKGPVGAVRLDSTGLAKTASLSAVSTPRPGQAGAPPPVQATAALAGRTQFKKGDRVTHPDHGAATVARDVGLNDARMDVDFDGEIDSLPVQGWSRL